MASVVVTWPMVTLAELLAPVSRPVRVTPTEIYALLGMHWYAEGLYIKDRKAGAQIQADTLFQVRAGDFVYNRLFAWKGSFGIADATVDGCYVSNEFPCFAVDETRLMPGFLRWYFAQSWVWDSVEAQSSGSTPTSRLRLKEPQLLAMRLPLPPLDEQRRIVARIAAIAARIEEARGLRRAAMEGAARLLEAAEMQIWPDEVIAGSTTLEAVTTFLARGRQSRQGDSDVRLIKTQHVQQGHLIPPQIALDHAVASKVGAEALVQKFDVLIACSAAGCLGRVAQFTGQVEKAATDTHVAIARPDQRVVLPDYLYAFLRGAQGQVQLRSRERGDWQREKVGFRLTELNLADLKRVPVPLPSIPEQRRILDQLHSVHARVDALKRLQAESAAELEALLPSVLDRAFRGEL